MPSSITIVTEPPSYSPVYNKVEFCADETGFLPSSQTNYKYIYNLSWDNGITSGTQKFYVPYFPDVSNTQFGILDVSRFLDSKLKERIPNATLPASTNGVYQGEDNFVVEYSVNVQSGWDVAGVFTEDPDGTGGTTSSTLYAWSGSFYFHDWIYQMNLASPFDTWLCNVTNGTGAKFLTDQPQTARYSQLNQLGWTYFMTDTLTDIDRVEVKTYSEADAGGSLVGTFIVGNFLTQTAIEERVMRMASGPGSLNNIPGGQLTSGSQPIIPSTGVASYTIQLQNSVGTAASEILVFNIVEECRYDTYRVHFMNELGGFDFYNFTSYSKLSTSISRKKYEFQRNRVDGLGLLYTQSDNGTSDYIVKYRNKVKLKSDYLTDEEVTWLRQLKTSPQVYLEFIPSEDPDLKQVYVIDTSWREFQAEHDKLFQIEIEIEESHQNIRQRR